jgi:hypothetical protein
MTTKSLDGVLIKKAHRSEVYQPEQIVEFAKCADPETGPQYFLNTYFYIQHPIKGKLRYKPYDYQTKLIDTYHNFRFSISMLPRQMGKTATAAGYLLWYGMFVPDSTILIAAHQYSGAQEIMQRIRYAYELCPDFIRAGVVSYNKGSIEFDNGSRILSQATTENTGRGLSISLLYADEFAFVRPTIASEFWTSISPTLATGGKAIITSTPNSDEDQFSIIWKQANKTQDEYGNETKVGINGFKAYRAYWTEHPDRDETWASQQRGSLGEERFKREMDCEFVISDETLINSLHLVNMRSSEVTSKTGQVRWFKKPDPTQLYVLGLDPSLGTGSDPAAIQVIEVPSCIQIAEWQHNKTPVRKQVKILQELTQYLKEQGVPETSIYYSVENNTLGEAALVAIEEIGEENFRGTFLSEPRGLGTSRKFRKGFTTTNTSKISACSKFKHLVENNKFTVNSANLLSELKTFVAAGVGYKAKPGCTDDLVMAVLLCVRMIGAMQSFESKIDMEMRENLGEDFIMPFPFIMTTG